MSGAAAAQTCPMGQLLCGTSHCAAIGTVCCASVGHEEVSCPGGTVCKADGTCGSTCMAGQTTTIATCGGDTCGCSAPCAHHKDCESTCCTTAGYCAPLCVCQNQGQLFLSCDKTGLGYGGLAVKGCSAAPGDRAPSPLALFAIAVALAALALRSGRARRGSRPSVTRPAPR